MHRVRGASEDALARGPAFPQISAPVRPPRPLFPPSRNTPSTELCYKAIVVAPGPIGPVGRRAGPAGVAGPLGSRPPPAFARFPRFCLPKTCRRVGRRAEKKGDHQAARPGGDQVPGRLKLNFDFTNSERNLPQQLESVKAELIRSLHLPSGDAKP